MHYFKSKLVIPVLGQHWFHVERGIEVGLKKGKTGNSGIGVGIDIPIASLEREGVKLLNC